MPKNKTEEKDIPNSEAKKWIEFIDKNGVKTNVGVFDGETDESALERARSIDARLGNEPTF